MQMVLNPKTRDLASCRRACDPCRALPLQCYCYSRTSYNGIEMHSFVFEGTWAEVAKKASQLKGTEKVRLEVLRTDASGQMIKKGMLTASRDITDEDFRAAEWHSLQDDL